MKTTMTTTPLPRPSPLTIPEVLRCLSRRSSGDASQSLAVLLTGLLCSGRAVLGVEPAEHGGVRIAIIDPRERSAPLTVDLPRDALTVAPAALNNARFRRASLSELIHAAGGQFITIDGNGEDSNAQ